MDRAVLQKAWDTPRTEINSNSKAISVEAQISVATIDLPLKLATLAASPLTQSLRLPLQLRHLQDKKIVLTFILFFLHDLAIAPPSKCVISRSFDNVNRAQIQVC